MTTFKDLKPGAYFKYPNEKELYMKIEPIQNDEKTKRLEMERISNLIADSMMKGDKEKAEHLTLFSRAIMDNDGKNAVKFPMRSSEKEYSYPVFYLKVEDDTEVIYMFK